MVKRMLLVTALTGALSLYSGSVAAEQERYQEQVQMQEQMQEQEQVYGSQLMTDKHRAEYHPTMRAAGSQEEREQIRWEHHERMKERAKELGVTLPDEPPARGPGMGPGGGGMGPGGGGMGPGGGRGQGR